MIVHLDDRWAVVVSCVAWTVIGFGTGWWCSRMRTGRLSHDTWLTRPRAWEDGGRVYERRLRIRIWKDRLPEAGGMFGGVPKRSLADASDATLQQMVVETRRAEWVHWLNAAAGPLFLIWCPPGLGGVMVVFGLVIHLPFVAIQRSNRFRLRRVLGRRLARGCGDEPPRIVPGQPTSAGSGGSSTATPPGPRSSSWRRASRSDT